ncbi:STAS domain-containing protein [Streptomyces iconiensis]|uniref:STAS domain-containing protein n=1 Tax=Streptomyces iconiensis TaxID=1384038 RepID=A0ABT6ZQ55_9ACTN|nr:STAS domain-containing protein [Streptomyces iconiensis]MDJ1131190.1 STAS domain-containing protein [Streptomyces iconiensis]
MGSWDSDRLVITSLAAGHESAVLRLSGELDHGSEMLYLDRIGAAVSAGYRYLVLDVTALVFCDSRGLNCLLALRWLLHRRDGMLLLACAGRHLAALLAVTGSTEALPVHLSVSQALATLPAEHRPAWPPADGTRPLLPLRSSESLESSWQQDKNPHLPPPSNGD